MFKNKRNRYITRGVNEGVDIRLQLLMWSIIDNLNEKGNVEVDYLQVFKLRKEGDSIIIEHSQEEPEYKAVYSLELQDVGLDRKMKIYVIDSGEYSTMPYHEELMSIQLIDINDLSIKEIEHRVKEILLKCSIELGLNFKVVKLDKKLRDIGIDTVYNLNIQENEYESEPLMYFDNGIATEDIRMKYLSYYQVLEYFFNRTQNYKLLDEIKTGNYIGESSINHTKLKKVLKKYVNSLSERESLKLVLSRVVDITRVKDWINSDPKRIEQYCNCPEPRINIDLTKSDEKIIGKLAEQIYYYRCAIAHAKGDTEEYLAIPEQSDEIIKNEIPLLKLIAEKVLKKCSEI